LSGKVASQSTSSARNLAGKPCSKSCSSEMQTTAALSDRRKHFEFAIDGFEAEAIRTKLARSTEKMPSQKNSFHSLTMLAGKFSEVLLPVAVSDIRFEMLAIRLAIAVLNSCT
jgi:hypothetical protein